MSRIFMDGGSDINLMFTSTLAAMRILLCSLEQSDTTFHDIVPGKGIFPLGKYGSTSSSASRTTSDASVSNSKWCTGHHNTTPSSGVYHSQGSWLYHTTRTCYSRCQDLGASSRSMGASPD